MTLQREAAKRTTALTGACDPGFAHLQPRTRETEATPAPIAVHNEAVAPVAQQQAPPPPRDVKHLASGRVAEILAPPGYKSSHADGAQEWPAVPTFEFSAKLTKKKEQAAFSVWALSGACDLDFAHLVPRTGEAESTPAPTVGHNETVAPVAQQ